MYDSASAQSFMDRPRIPAVATTIHVSVLGASSFLATYCQKVGGRSDPRILYPLYTTSDDGCLECISAQFHNSRFTMHR